jgi:hypothetical protein
LIGTGPGLGRNRSETPKAVRAAKKKRTPIRTHPLAPRAINTTVSSIMLWQIPRKTSTRTKSLLVRLPSLAKEMITPEPKTIPKKRPASKGYAALFDSLSPFITGCRKPAARSSRWESFNNANPTINGIIIAVSNSVIRTLLVSISPMICGQSNMYKYLVVVEFSKPFCGRSVDRAIKVSGFSVQVSGFGDLTF